MKKQLLKTKSIHVEGMLVATEVYLTKKICSHKNNAGKELNAGWNAISVDCNPKCPAPTLDGYHLCIGGSCVYVPN